VIDVRPLLRHEASETTEATDAIATAETGEAKEATVFAEAPG
jgi:hypothetical protein